MNHILLQTRILASILMLCPVLLDSCKESTEDDPSPTIGIISVADPDKATKSLKFDNATEVNGPLESVPSSANLDAQKRDQSFAPNALPVNRHAPPFRLREFHLYPW